MTSNAGRHPIILERHPLTMPTQVSRGKGSPEIIEGIEEEYDDYVCTSCSPNDCPGDWYRYGCYYEYVGLTVTRVHMKSVLAGLFRCSEEDIPQELMDIAAKHGLDKPSAYEIVTAGGYSGQTYGVYLKSSSALQEMADWYYSHPNAHDVDGVLEYVRSKGVDTAGLRPLEAIKRQLLVENNGMVLKELENARSIESRMLAVRNITVPNPQHFAKAEPREAISHYENQSPVQGIVIAKPVTPGGAGENRFVLIDGYHRLKALAGDTVQDVMRSTESGKFFVISLHG